ncbi:unnamed protein product [Ixodes pacificus]
MWSMRRHEPSLPCPRVDESSAGAELYLHCARSALSSPEEYYLTPWPGRSFGARGSGSTEHQRAVSRGAWKSAHTFCSGEDPKHTRSVGRSVFRHLAAAGRRGSHFGRCLPLHLFRLSCL